MRRYEIDPRLRGWIDPLLPESTHHGGRGRPWKDHHTIIYGILWVVHSGAPWRDLPERYGPWQTVYDRFNRWRQCRESGEIREDCSQVLISAP
jgi:transposase